MSAEMKIGIIVPQGWILEYEGWAGDAAWSRTRHVAQQADSLGFESIWLYDHFHTIPKTRDEITFEAFTTLTALAGVTQRVRLGHVVLCAGYRNPALTAKMITTLDVVSGGRAELGIGAGWKKDEWLAYGYEFPPAAERLAMLRDQLEIVRAMMGPGRATFAGIHHSVDGAVNEPKPIQHPMVPIMVGGNGPNVTWRLAARYADELNLDGLTPAETAAALPTIRARCEEIDRDPASLAVSVHVWHEDLATTGQQRADLIGAYRELGVARLIGMVRACVDRDEALVELAADARAGGATIADRSG
jgi:F420-dependent oxidoreductase-like protein